MSYRNAFVVLILIAEFMERAWETREGSGARSLLLITFASKFFLDVVSDLFNLMK